MEFAILGIDVISGGNINTNSSGGSNGQGEVTFSGGSAVFEADDIIVFEVVNPTAAGEIGSGTAISDATVFEDYDDYLAYVASVDAGTPDTSLIKYNYAPQNPGQTANVQSDISGLGDSYVRFNANILIPQDGGPAFNTTLTIAPGTNIADPTTGSVTLDRVRDFDINGDDAIDPTNQETGNAEFFLGDYIAILNGAPVCFTQGTMINTDQGARAIETLAHGDLVFTLDNGYQPVRWIGRKRLPATRRFAPVHFAAGAIGNSHPLEVSQNHRMLLRDKTAELLFGEPEVLIAAKFMINGDTIRLRRGGWVDYVHILFERHEIIIANGVPSESLFPVWEDMMNNETAAAQDDLIMMFPDAFEHVRRMRRTARPSLRRYEAELLRH